MHALYRLDSALYFGFPFFMHTPHEKYDEKTVQVSDSIHDVGSEQSEYSINHLLGGSTGTPSAFHPFTPFVSSILVLQALITSLSLARLSVIM